jgi:hypothetical protein
MHRIRSAVFALAVVPLLVSTTTRSHAATLSVATNYAGGSTALVPGQLINIDITASITDPSTPSLPDATGIANFTFTLQISDPAVLSFESFSSPDALFEPILSPPDAVHPGLYTFIAGAFDESQLAGATSPVTLASIVLRATAPGSSSVQAAPGPFPQSSFTLFPFPLNPVAGPYIETDGTFLAGPAFDVAAGPVPIPLPNALPAGLLLLAGLATAKRPARQSARA